MLIKYKTTHLRLIRSFLRFGNRRDLIMGRCLGVWIRLRGYDVSGGLDGYL